MSWNYRVVSRVFNSATGPETTYGIHEAYYNKHDHVRMISEDPMDPHGETVEELRADYDRMAKAFERPIIDYDEVGNSTCPQCVAEREQAEREHAKPGDQS